VAGAQSIQGSDQTGRLGVMYFRSLLAQAGVAHGEFSPGEDYLAVDVTVEFPTGGVRVQIKTGTKRLNMDGSITVPVTDVWTTRSSRESLASCSQWGPIAATRQPWWPAQDSHDPFLWGGRQARWRVPRHTRV
jgi:hypothetical protein